MGLISADDAVNATVMVSQAMVDYADVWAPATVTTSKIMGNGSGGPFTLAEGGTKWRDAAGMLQEAQARLAELVDALPRDYWDGEDRERFDTEMRQLQAQLGDSSTYAMAVGITLDALAVPIGIWPVVCLGIGVLECALASAFYAATASVVGDLGASEALFAEGEAASAACLTVITASMTALIALMAAGTAAIVISDAADIDAQMHDGDSGALAEFGKAAVDSSGEVALNVAVGLLNRGKDEQEPAKDAPHGKHEKPADEPSEPSGKDVEPGGKDAAPGGKDGDDGGSPPRHMPKHRKPTDWGDTYKERRTDWLVEKTREKSGDIGSKPLSELINAGMSSVVPGWNDPDAPSADEEDWGAG
jgi:hypothetical protein